MADYDRIRRNVAKLTSKGRDQNYIKSYLDAEGVKPEELGQDNAAPEQKAKAQDPLIEKAMSAGRSVIANSPPGLLVRGAEALTGGAAEDLLPDAGMIAAPIGLEAATGGAGTAGVVAAAAAGRGAGQAARQGIRALRGKDTNLKDAAISTAKSTAAGAASEVVSQAAMKGLTLTGKALASTPLGKSTISLFGRAMTKAAGYGAKGQKAFGDVLNFMGDLNPKSVEYAMKRGPMNVFKPENLEEGFVGKQASKVVKTLEQLRTGSNQAYSAQLKDVYRTAYAKKYPFKVPTPKGLEKMANETRIYGGRIYDAGEKAMRDFGYKNSFGKVKPTIMGELGSKLDEAERLQQILDRVRGFKHMTADDALTFRQELDDIIYDGWKNAKTKESIGQASGPARSVLQQVRKETTDRVRTRLGTAFSQMDQAYGETMDTVRRAKPLYEDTIKAEKTMRKYTQFTKGENAFTQGEMDIINEVDKIAPHVTAVKDHLVAKQFEPVIGNFWRSRALQGLAIGGGGFALGGPAGAAVAGAGAMAASSPKLIKGALINAEKVSKTAKAVATGAGKVAKKVIPAAARVAVAHKAESKMGGTK